MPRLSWKKCFHRNRNSDDGSKFRFGDGVEAWKLPVTILKSCYAFFSKKSVSLAIGMGLEYL